MGICRWMAWNRDIQEIVQNNTARYYYTLTNFKSIDSRENIDRIGAEDTQ